MVQALPLVSGQLGIPSPLENSLRLKLARKINLENFHI